MVGIMELHDHLMFFILMIFNLKIIFFVAAIISSRQFTQIFDNKTDEKKEVIFNTKEFNNIYAT